MKNKNVLIGVLVGLVIILLAWNIYTTNRVNNLLKNYQTGSFQFEVPTGPFLNAENDIKPEPFKKNNTLVGQVISQQEAENLVKKTWGDCSGEGCSNFKITVGQNNLVAGIYPQLDDSVAFVKKEAIATYQNGVWVLGTPTITQSCHLNRGHQDFSTEPCL